MSKQTLNPPLRPAASRPRSKLWHPLLCALALWAAAARSGTPLSPQQLEDIQASAALGGITLDLDLATETFEDSTVLFVPAAGDPQRMLLYDTHKRRAVVIEMLGPEGFGFQLVDSVGEALPVELYLGGDGYFGPPEALGPLGLSDAALAAVQGSICAQVCFEHAQMPACAACTAVGMLLTLRHPAPPEAPPTPEFTPPIPPSPEPSPAETAEPTPPLPESTETPAPPPVETLTPFETPTPPPLPVDTETPEPPPVETLTPFETPAPSPEITPDPTAEPGTPTAGPAEAPTPEATQVPPVTPPAIPEPNAPPSGELP